MCIIRYASLDKSAKSPLHKAPIVHTEIPAKEYLLDAAAKLHPLIRCIVAICHPIFGCNDLLPLRINDDDIGIAAGKKRALCRVYAVKLCLILRQNTAEALR